MKFHFVPFICLTLAATSHALPGLSSVWERLYNSNEPFSETNPDHLPTADPDGDGFTNAQESAAGTDPFSGLPPEGMPQLRIAPHLWLPNQYTLSLSSSRPGKNYLLSHSTTLQTGGWTPFPEAIPGDGNELRIDFQPETPGEETPPEKAFFRATISDQPNPGGPYTPWELGILSTHPDIADALLPPSGGTYPPDGSDEPPPDPDSDGTGPSDRYDAAPRDSRIDWLKSPQAKYLHIPVSGLPAGFQAIDVSDSGKILFGRTTAVNDYATEPVGFVWDPAAPPANRLTPVTFTPTDFTLTFRKTTYTPTGSEVTYVSEDAPLPEALPPGSPEPPSRPITLAVSMRAIGHDGSLLANAYYNRSENTGNSEGSTYHVDTKVTFLWSAGQYGACRMLGENRGFRQQGEVRTCDHTAGFYTTEETINNIKQQITRAVITEQTLHNNGSAPLNIRAIRTDNLASSTLTGQSGRLGDTDPWPAITRTGRVLIRDYSNNILTYHLCGTAPFETLPTGTLFTTVSDLPDGSAPFQWGLGTHGQSFRFRVGNGFEGVTSATHVLQWDRQGNGIGSDATRALWSNTRWYSLAEITGLLPNTFNDQVPRKITPHGLIWIGNETRTQNALLIPVEIIVPDLDHNEIESDLLVGADELKVAKMEHSLDANGVLYIDDDPHRFHIRIPSPLGGSNASALIGTVENPDAAYNDNPTEIPLEATPYAIWSQSQMLVSDEIDDAADGVDDRVGDRTHKVQLGGKVEVASIKLGENTYPLGMKIPVKKKKRIEGKIVLVGSANTYGVAVLNIFKSKAQERFAQLGIDCESLTITNMDVPDGVLETEVRYDGMGGFVISGKTGFYVHGDVKKLVDKAILENKRGSVTVFIVQNIGDDEPMGFAITERKTHPDEIQYANVAVVSVEKTLAQNSHPFTLAHEVGHVITNHGHYGIPNFGESPNDYYGADPQDHKIEHNLMKGEGTSPANTLGASKRLHTEQLKMLQNELLVEP